ncbi:hypothetical protein V8D89_003540 [Ganoderma adspersum]
MPQGLVHSVSFSATSCFDVSHVSLDEERKRLISEAGVRRSTIQQLTSEVAGLLAAHNAITPAAALPPELFSNIFGYLHGPMGIGADLVRATHVCKRWRAVALQDPCLWSSFAIHNISCVTTCLSRSRDRPISLFLTARMPPSMELVVARVTRRIRSLYVAIPDAGDIEKLLKRLSRPAPLLETLHIAYFDDSDGTIRDRPVQASISPLFNSQLPSLLSLTLHRVKFPFTLPRTLLHLDYSIEDEDMILEEILPILAAVPLLESLKLAGTIELKLEGPPNYLTVDLPNLASLVLELQDPRSVPRLLSALSLPPSVNVEITTDLAFDDYVTDSFGDIIHGVSPATHSTLRSLSGMRRLEFSWDFDRLLVQARRDPGDYTGTPAWSITGLGVADGWMGLLDCWPLLDRSQLEVLVVTREQTLWGNGWHTEGWPALLRSMPALKTLRVICLGQGDARLLLETLCDSDADTELACPSLETLEILDVDMSGWVSNLHTLALARGSACTGGALKRVELFNCGLCASGKWKKFMESSCNVEVSVDEV